MIHNRNQYVFTDSVVQQFSLKLSSLPIELGSFEKNFSRNLYYSLL